MGLTTDRNDPALKQTTPNGQQEKYLVLSEEERAKGFVRPVRRSYKHLACGNVIHARHQGGKRARWVMGAASCVCVAVIAWGFSVAPK